MKTDLIVIGAGAAGLMCAATAAQRGVRVVVLEKSAKAGRKILMSGGGRCNFTNLDVTPDNYLSANPHFCKSALKRYTQWDFLALVNHYHIAYHERDHGQLFCNDSAKDILNLLLRECDKGDFQLITRCAIEQVRFDARSEQYRLNTNLGEFEAPALVVATGGLSIPSMGGDGFGYRLAEQFGLNTLPTRAGLVPFRFSGVLQKLCETLSGIAVPATLSFGDQAFTENLLFTHRGMSGPAVLQISNYWAEGQAVSINLLPNASVSDWLRTEKQGRSKQLLRNYLTQHLPKRLVQGLEPLQWAKHAELPLAQWPDKVLSHTAEGLNAWPVKPSGTEGYRTAEVTLGGVDTDELSSKTMESKRQRGLYFVGEAMDVTGHLGGYNFQWAWASGYAAGEAIARAKSHG